MPAPHHAILQAIFRTLSRSPGKARDRSDTSAGHDRDPYAWLMGMNARRVLALALLTGPLTACGLLVGVDELGVDPADASSPPVVVDGDAPDVREPQPMMDATVVMDAAVDGAPAFRRVFLTSTETPNGILSGISGGDAICAAAVTSAKLGGTWVAWLSGNGKNAIERVTFNGPYRLLDNTPVVTDRTQLVTTGPSHAINVMENGQVATDSEPWVWTGTQKNGVASNFRCTDWTKSDAIVYGVAGSFDQTNKWTDNGGPGAGFPGFGCQTNARLYCFEQ